MAHQGHIPALKKVNRGRRGADVEVAHITFTHIPLAKASLDHTYLQGMLGNVIFTQDVMCPAKTLHY